MADPGTLTPPPIRRDAGPSLGRRLRPFRGWAVAILIVAALLTALQLLVMRSPPVEVRVIRVRRGAVEETVTSTKAGAIRSRMASDVSVDAAGAIVAIHAREGRAVRAGEPLISIDRRDADAALAASKRELAVLEANAVEVRARHRDAVRERGRIEGLRATGVITESELDRAQTQVDALAASVAAAEARIEAQKAAAERAAIAVEKCDIHAPFDGMVAELFVEVGEWATPGKVAMRLIDPDRLYVRAELDEVDLGPLKTGLPARVTLDPYKDRKLEGRVTRIAPYVSEAQEQNRTVEIEVELAGDLAGLHLKPGTSADVEVILRRAPDALRIPTLALTEGDRVLTVDSDRRARAAAVRIGLRNWEFAEVLEGLREGDPVIVSLESEKVKDGAAVRVVHDE